MRPQAVQRLCSTVFGRPVTALHAVWAGVFSVLGCGWVLCTVVFGWPSPRLPALGGAVIVPSAFVAGLATFAFSVVALVRQRNWRLGAAALLGLAGVSMFTVSFLLAARHDGQ
jgi:hypothetical protein